jgi:hypothetical protein
MEPMSESVESDRGKAMTPEEELRAIAYVIQRFEAELRKEEQSAGRTVLTDALNIMRHMCSTILEKKERPPLH